MIIYYEKKPMCYKASENAHQYFTRDDDGYGVARGKFLKKITKITPKHGVIPPQLQSDEICVKYRLSNRDDTWLWSHDFYVAPIEDLEHILVLLKEDLGG